MARVRMPTDDWRPETPATQRGRATRQRVIEVTAQLVALHGVNGVSLRGVAARVGISHSAILRYFPTRAALLQEALKSPGVFGLNPSGPQSSGLDADAATIVNAVCEVLTELARDSNALARYARLALETVDRSHPAHVAQAEQLHALCRALSSSLEAATTTGRAGTGDVDPSTAARLFFAGLDGLLLHSLMLPGRAATIVTDAQALARALGVSSDDRPLS